ncbi:MAG: hypothetical protein IJN72_06715 [Firmicutes bacterium]|nr:hypothetical protein [Bacillota bacterium]
MSEILKICAIAMAGIILIALIKTYKPEFTVEIIICVSVIILWAAADSLIYVFTYMENLYGQLSYGKEYFPVIIKALAIAYLTEFTASLCEDAGQKSIGTKVELAGKIAVFFVAIPVFTSLLDLLTSLM